MTRKQPPPPLAPRHPARREDRKPPALESMPDPMTVGEVSLLLRSSRSKVYDLIRDGLLRALPLGRGPKSPKLIYRQDFLAFITQGKTPAAPGAA